MTIKYNLYAFLKALFPTYTFVVDGWTEESPNDSFQIMETGGSVEHWFYRKDPSFQIMCRGLEKYEPSKKINEVFDVLRNRFGLKLPEYTYGVDIYPEVTTAQISPIQLPGYIGADENKRHMYSFNIEIVVGG